MPHRDITRDLIVQAEKNRITSESLDEAVHEAKANEAAEINNGGLESQIPYLVEFYGSNHVRELVETESPIKH